MFVWTNYFSKEIAKLAKCRRENSVSHVRSSKMNVTYMYSMKLLPEPEAIIIMVK